MTPRPVLFRQLDLPNEATPNLSPGVQIVDTFGFEIIEQLSPIPPANHDEHERPVPFAATLRRIA
jgi:hypothetical protein